MVTYKTPEEILKEEEEKRKKGEATQIFVEDGTYTDLGFESLAENFYMGK